MDAVIICQDIARKGVDAILDPLLDITRTRPLENLCFSGLSWNNCQT